MVTWMEELKLWWNAQCEVISSMPCMIRSYTIDRPYFMGILHQVCDLVVRYLGSYVTIL